MNKNVLVCLLSAAALIACATGSSVRTGVNSVGDMNVATTSEWRSVTDTGLAATNGTSRTWTKTSVARERLLLIAGIKDGSPVFRSGGQAFNSAMTASEIEELVQSLIPVVLGSPSADIQVQTSREQGFGQNGGVFIEFSSSTEQQGMAGAFVYESALYVNLFVAANAQAFAEIGEEAEAVIMSASTRVKTTGKF